MAIIGSIIPIAMDNIIVVNKVINRVANTYENRIIPNLFILIMKI